MLMPMVRYIFLSSILVLMGCDKIVLDKSVEDEELVSPEEKKALEKFGDRLAES